MISHRRCAKCDIDTGIKGDGSYTPYTLHPYRAVQSSRDFDRLAVFCATCFDELGSARARDRVARSAAPHLRAVAS